jgi:hypothetical protein
MPRCPHPNTAAQDGTPAPRLVCEDCGAVIVEVHGFVPTGRVGWVRRELERVPASRRIVVDHADSGIRRQ